MMNLLYVGAAVVVSLLASLVVVLRNRRPRSLQSGVQEFARELQALAPGAPVTSGRRKRR